MNVLEKVIALFDQYNEDFDILLPFYLKYGIVISTPTLFAMAKKISHIDHSYNDFSYDPNGEILFVQCALGNLKELKTFIPKDIKSICFCRHGKENLHFYPIDKFLKKIK